MFYCDFRNPLFEIPVRRKPAPRLFCDICDQFDLHDTEDCPVQSSEDSPVHVAGDGEQSNGTVKKRVLPPPRKYCESCEGKEIFHFDPIFKSWINIFDFSAFCSFRPWRRRMWHRRNILIGCAWCQVSTKQIYSKYTKLPLIQPQFIQLVQD